jgi:hypothetical protein
MPDKKNTPVNREKIETFSHTQTQGHSATIFYMSNEKIQHDGQNHIQGVRNVPLNPIKPKSTPPPSPTPPPKSTKND